MNFRNPLRLRHLVLLAGTALCGAAGLVAAVEAPTISVSDSSLVRPTTATEAMEFIVTRSGDTSFPVTVGYRTQDNIAKAGVDYTAARGVVTISAGATSAAVQIPVLPGGASSASRDFRLELTGASGPLVEGAELTAKVRFETDRAYDLFLKADFNGDGRLDLASVLDSTVAFFLNTTAQGELPSFSPHTNPPLPDLRHYIQTADLNEDDKPDLVLLSYDSDSISVLINTTPEGSFVPQFAVPVTFASGRSSGAISIADFNGDDKPDIAVISSEFSVGLFLNNTRPGSATAEFATVIELHDIAAYGDSVSIVRAFDLNGDHKPDLATNTPAGPRMGGFELSFAVNTTGAEGGAPSFMRAGPTYGYRSPSAAADMNGDGLPELFVNREMWVNTTPVGTTALSFADPIVLDDFVYVATDIDADGRPDIASRDSVLFNATAVGDMTPSFGPSIRFELASIVSTGDFDGDGKHELFAFDYFARGFSVGILPFLPVGISKSQGTATILSNADTTPTAFRFKDRRGVALGQTQTSNAITVRGINTATSIAVSGGKYSINGGPFGSAKGQIRNGDSVRVRHISAGKFSTRANTRLSIGGVSDTFTTKTRPRF